MNPLERVLLLDRYVRIPTVSRHVTAEQIRDVRELWRELGLDLEPLAPGDGAGTPALFGTIPGPPGAPTVLLYGHWDVQPTGDIARWRWHDLPCPPFEPTYFLGEARVDPRACAADRLGELVMVARGGADNKGQHLANALGALDAARAGTLRWTVKVILDGEEEHGSPSLGAIAERHRARLAADALICSDGPRRRSGAALVMGVRGLLDVELTAENGERASVHSGNYGNVVPNPALPLLELVRDIEGRVRGLALARDAFRREAETAFAPWARDGGWQPHLWPNVNVNRLISDGAWPEARRTIIPRRIDARLDIRLTPDTPPDAVRAAVEAAVAEHNTRAAGVRFTARVSGQPASYTSPRRPEFGWLLELLAAGEAAPPVALPTLGGTLPTWVFTEVLGMPGFLIPSANPDNQQHDVNEHYRLERFFAQADLYRRIVSSLPPGR